MFKLEWKELLKSFLMVFIGFLAITLINAISYALDISSTLNIIKRIYTLDAYWYESIVNHGYMPFAIGDPNNEISVIGGNAGMANWAFFPLLPFIIKFLLTITFNLISIEVISFIFSFVCYVFMVYNVILYLKEKNKNVDYSLLFLIFVYSFVLMMFFSLYTETLTMLLIILLIRVCDKKRYLLGGGLCALLSMIKVQGCFWCIYLFVKIYQENIVKGKNIFQTFFLTIKAIICRPVHFLSLCIAPLGLFVFLTCLAASGLSILSFMHVQSSWGKENKFFLITIINAIAEHKALEGIIAIFFIFFTIYLLYKKKYLFFSMMCLYILSSTTSSVSSVYRYVLGSVIYPIELYLLVNEIKVNKKNNIGNIIALDIFYFLKYILVTSVIIVYFVFGAICY